MFRPKPRYVALPSPRSGLGEEIDRLTCPKCDTPLEPARLDATLRVCYRCGYHFRLRAQERIAMLTDAGSFVEEDREIEPRDALGFSDSQPYTKRIEQSRTSAGINEAAVWGEARIGGKPLVIVCLDFAFMGGSMGAATGEKITNGIERATRRRLPLVIVSASGGARMQEGMLSLMQMAKTAAAIGRHGMAGLPYVSILTDPTMGGVTASFASTADVILAEPGAMIGFAGPRVIQQATYETLPDGFQTAEFLWKHGLIDLVVPRAELPACLKQLLLLYTRAPAGVLPLAARTGMATEAAAAAG
ncbi:MAG TPA: acetyl-CoA carboxylase, carboxyltransferase subunit beta [Candidatus Limnocylindrales bacterium]|nr:acetyl-CoA carboxylase, carboxyltransferase subunit beta [Candidatus Limnocylindrales bacterium]